MARYIAKFTDGEQNKDYYLDWSTVVDAPVTYGMGLEEFKEYYRDEYGKQGMADFEERMARVHEKGNSSMIDGDTHDLIKRNCAGKEGKSLSYKKILREYCLLPNQRPPVYLHGNP